MLPSGGVRSRRITVWGWGALALLVASVVFAFLDSRGRSPARSVAWFVGAAAISWYIISVLFRWHDRLAIVMTTSALWLAVFIGSAIALPSPTASGLTFGALVAWFPHCWEVVGVEGHPATEDEKRRNLI